MLDIEVFPAIYLAYDLRTQYINKQMILERRRTFLVCAKWTDDPEIFTFAEWHDGGHRKMLEDIWSLMNEADAIVTFNGDNFDLKELAAEFMIAGMDAPSGYKSIDLYKAVKRRARFMSSSLQYVAESLGLRNQKLDSGGIETVKALMHGDELARADLERYCAGDVLATEEAFARLRNWLPVLPNIALIDGTRAGCPSCGSLRVVRQGYAYTASGAFQRYRCRECNRWSRGASRIATTDLRPAS